MSMAAHSNIPIATAELPPSASERLTRPFQRFAELSSASGIILLMCTVVALVWANSSFGHLYETIFRNEVLTLSAILPGAADGDHVVLAHNLEWWINDVLMVVFFLLVGLEIKRELLVGELNSVKKATLPIFAAFGGMIVPAGIYALVNMGEGGVPRGWGVPMATDIAFALGMMALLGSRVPNSLKIFLTSLAIADDLGALIVIAVFYTEQLHWHAMGYAAGVLGVLIALNMLGFRRALWYLIPGVFLWWFIHESGIHATIAGVLLACTIPTRSRVDADLYLAYSRSALDAFERHSVHGETIQTNSSQRAAVHAINQNNKFLMPLLHRMEHNLHPWVAFVVIPVFALANAGLILEGSLVDAFKDPVTVGVALGLLIGKPLGVIGMAWLACRTGLGALPKGVTWRHMLGAGLFAGIGFTMALFIAHLAFPGEHGHAHLDHAKIGILTASTIATIAGSIVLLSCRNAPEPEPEQLGPELHPDDQDEPGF